MRCLHQKSRDERGSMIIAMMVIFVATGLIVSVVALVYNSMKVTRRSGDSANALQLADAAVNDAVKDIPTVGGIQHADEDEDARNRGLVHLQRDARPGCADLAHRRLRHRQLRA